MLGVSRHTIRHALATLAAEGRLRRARGHDTVVTAPPRLLERDLSRPALYAFVWEAEARGAVHASTMLSQAQEPADSAPAEHFGIARETPVTRVLLLRHADGEPLILEFVVLPVGLGLQIERLAFERTSVYDSLERLGARVTRARETIRPLILDRLAASRLGVAAGAPAFGVERRSWAGDRPVEWRFSLVRGDRYLYSIDLERDE